MTGELKCCLFCGRDTRSKSQVCSRCEGVRAFGGPASHYEAISKRPRPSVCSWCGREFRGAGEECEECRDIGSEVSYHGENYGDDDYGR